MKNLKKLSPRLLFVKIAIIMTLMFFLIGNLRAEVNIYNSKQIYDDLLYLEKILEEYHPNLYAHNSKISLQKKYRSLRESLPIYQDNWSASLVIQRAYIAEISRKGLNSPFEFE